MCQTQNKRMFAFTTIGYRVYQWNSVTHEYLSYFEGNPMTRIGEWRKARYRTSPFHAYATLEDVWRAFNYRPPNSPHENIKVYKCKLKGRLLKGIWLGRPDIQTITGYQLKVIEEVNLAT